MNLNDYKKAEQAAYGEYMYYEAAERGYDAEGSRKAWKEYLDVMKRREEAEEVGNRNVLASLIELVNYNRSPGQVPLDVLLTKAQEAIDFMTGEAV